MEVITEEMVGEKVKDYLDTMGKVFPNYNANAEDKNHVINTGTNILMAKFTSNFSYVGGFGKTILENDLTGAFNKADYINVNFIRFYVMLVQNVSFS